MYRKLMEMSGEPCYTLTFGREATMHVDEKEVTIVYPSGNDRKIPRVMVEQAIGILLKTGRLTVSDVHEGITNRNGAQTDRLMAVLSKLPGVTDDRRPRVLYYSSASANEGMA